VFTINSNISVFKIFWNNANRRITSSHSKSKFLSVKLFKGNYKIEQSLLLLEDDFNTDIFKLILDGKL
jgi:hypothetical protein